MRVQLSFILLFFSCFALAQNPDGFEEMIEKTVKGTVPYISSEDLAQLDTSSIYILDTREIKEFEMSHIPGSRYCGYKDLNQSLIDSIPTGVTIVTYCSVGYRSERVGLRLLSAGHERVFNLKGGIFDWVNNGYDVIGSNPEAVHGYNKKWSEWVNKKRSKVFIE